MEQATVALKAPCPMREALALSFEADSIIRLLTGAMNTYTNSVDLQRYGIGILGLFFFVSDRILNFLSDPLVTAIMRFIEEEVDKDDAADLIATVVNMILVMTNKRFQGVTILLRNEKRVDSIVGCVYKYPNSLSIQGAGTDILSNIMLDNYIQPNVYQRGGMSRIISALDTLKHDPLTLSGIKDIGGRRIIQGNVNGSCTTTSMALR